jgi:hypothetical protein
MVDVLVSIFPTSSHFTRFGRTGHSLQGMSRNVPAPSIHRKRLQTIANNRKLPYNSFIIRISSARISESFSLSPRNL